MAMAFEHTSNQMQVAVFIDYENIQISVQSILGEEFEVDWSRLMDVAVGLGRVVVRRAYGDWSLFKPAQRELQGLGIELVHVTGKRGKNAADLCMAIDAMEVLLDEQTNITHFLLVSGDGDFTYLVHRLRLRGKIVTGLGVSGASSEYLINACDRFIFYETLMGETQQESSDDTKGSEAAIGETSRAGFDVSEARQLLRRAMQSIRGSWVNAAAVKAAMMGLDPAFDERNYSYNSFKDFLSGQNDIVRLRTAEGGHMEVQFITETKTDTVSSLQAPEALLDQYLHILATQKILMSPTEHRPPIILKFFEIFKSNKGKSLSELRDELHGWYEDNAPGVKWQYINEAVHQMFHTYCFEFDQSDKQYPQGTRLWDRKFKLNEKIKSARDLLDTCDRGLLQRIGRKLGSYDKINSEVAARLLYGGVRGQKMLEHVRELITELKN